MLWFCSHRQRYIRRSSHYAAGKRPEEIPRFQSSSGFQEGTVRSSFLLWLLETRLECCDRDCERWLFWEVSSQHFSELRYSSLPHPWTEPRRAISHYPDPTAHARLRYRGFPKHKGGGQKCCGLFYTPALTSVLSGMMEAVYCFTGERFTEETLRNTETQD